MKQEIIELSRKVISGIKTYSSFTKELDPQTSKIFPLVHQYFSSHVADRFIHRKNPEHTFAVYTEYTSNYQGEYMYLIGEETEGEQSNRIAQIEIPAGTYMCFTTDSGEIPAIVVDAWKEIWAMEDRGELMRKYTLDFEWYDPKESRVQIFLSI